MRLESALDRLHARTVRNPWLRLFSAMVRGLLAAGFIQPGMTKVLGYRFTGLPTTHPVGYFFDAFFQAEEFYFFVGAAQVLAGVLLLFRRTTTLGVVLYFPIILNIFVINVAVGFSGTYWITGMMLLACTYLLCWDYDRWKLLLPGFGAPPAPPAPAADRHLGTGMTVLAGGVAGLAGLGIASAAIAWQASTGFGRPLLLLTGSVLLAAAVALVYRRRLAPTS